MTTITFTLGKNYRNISRKVFPKIVCSGEKSNFLRVFEMVYGLWEKGEGSNYEGVLRKTH